MGKNRAKRAATAILNAMGAAAALCFSIAPSIAAAVETKSEAEPGEATSLPTCDGEEDELSPCGDPAFTTVIVGKQPEGGTVSTIDATEISRRGARNLPDALALEPGVEINRSPKAGAAVQIRGFDERAVLLTVEGIPIREVFDGHFDISSLPTFSLGSIEIERGVASVLHGPGSAGGVVALKAPRRCGDAADISFFGGPRGDGGFLLGGAVGACLELSDFSVNASLGHERSDGYPISKSYEPTEPTAQFHEDGGIRDGSDYRRSSMAYLLKYAQRKNKELTLFLNALDAPRGIPPFEGLGYVRYWRYRRYGTFLAGLSGVLGPEPSKTPATWGFRELGFHAYVHVHRDEIRDYEDATYARLTTNPLAWFVASAYASETYGAALRGAWSLNRKNRLDVSLGYDLDRHRQRELPVPRNVAATDWTPWERYFAHTFSAAVEDTQELGRTRLIAGAGASGMSLLAQEIRETDYPVDHRVIPAVEARVVSETDIGDRLVLTAAAGRKVRFPTLKELFSNAVGGNPDLKSERAWMAEAGFDTRGALVEGLDTKVRLFWNSIQDLIERYREVYANIGRAVTAGVEIETRYRPVGVLEIFSGYRYMYARDLVHDRPLDYRSPHRVVAGQRLITEFGLTLSMDVVYSASQRSYYVDSASGQWIEDVLPPYVLTNAHARYERPINDLAALYFFIDGFNLLDTNYYVGSFEPRPGREFVVGLGGRM